MLVRDLTTEWGPLRHMMIGASVDGIPPTWAEKQRIKNELGGRERAAIEVFPAASRLVDGADAYHLWLLPADMRLPFGLHRDDAGNK